MDVYRIGNVCCLPAPVHQPLSFNSFDLSVYCRNVHASGTLKSGYEGVFKIVLVVVIIIISSSSSGVNILNHFKNATLD